MPATKSPSDPPWMPPSVPKYTPEGKCYINYTGRVCPFCEKLGMFTPAPCKELEFDYWRDEDGEKHTHSASNYDGVCSIFLEEGFCRVCGVLWLNHLAAQLPEYINLHLCFGKYDVGNANPNNNRRVIAWYPQAPCYYPPYNVEIATTLKVEDFAGKQCVLVALSTEIYAVKDFIRNPFGKRSPVLPIGIWCLEDNRYDIEHIPESLELLTRTPVIGKAGNPWRNVYNHMISCNDLGRLMKLMLFGCGIGLIGCYFSLLYFVGNLLGPPNGNVAFKIIAVASVVGLPVFIYGLVWLFLSLFSPGAFNPNNTVYSKDEASAVVRDIFHHLRKEGWFQSAKLRGSSDDSRGSNDGRL